MPLPILEALAILERHKEHFFARRPRLHAAEEDWLRTHPKLGFAFAGYRGAAGCPGGVGENTHRLRNFTPPLQGT